MSGDSLSSLVLSCSLGSSCFVLVLEAGWRDCCRVACMFALIVCAGTVLSAGLDGAFFFASRFCFVVTRGKLVRRWTGGP